MIQTMKSSRAIPAKVGTGFASGIASEQRDRATPAKVGTGFASGIASSQRDRAFPVITDNI
jgi:hypothetical protein